VAARSTQWVYGHSLAEIAGSNPAGGMMPVSVECCVSSGRGLFVGADHSSREVLPGVVCLSVIVKPR
jgi:hypothetical protein